MTPVRTSPSEGPAERRANGISLALSAVTIIVSVFAAYFTWGVSQEHRTTRLEESVEQLKKWREEQREDFKALLQKLDSRDARDEQLAREGRDGRR